MYQVGCYKLKMKKTLIISIILLILFNNSYAQPDVIHSTFSLIPQVGFNVSRLTTDAESGGRLGLQFGTEARIGEAFYVQPGFYWLRQIPQFIQHHDQASELTEDDIAINGFQVSGLVGYKFINTEILIFRFQAGPAMSWVHRVRNNAFGLAEADFNSSIWGAKMGIGADIYFVTFDINYEIGLSEVFTNVSTARNNVFSVNLGLRLDF
jgi:hypothetical protein